MNAKVYKCCAVPLCRNTSITTPEKVFVYVPNKKEVRDKWLKLAHRDPSKVKINSTIYFCEDHFDLANDMENYMQYHLMGMVSQVRMNRGCMPSKFECQHRKKRTSTTSERPFKTKKLRMMVFEECEKQTEENIATECLRSEEIASSSSDHKMVDQQDEHTSQDKDNLTIKTFKLEATSDDEYNNPQTPQEPYSECFNLYDVKFEIDDNTQISDVKHDISAMIDNIKTEIVPDALNDGSDLASSNETNTSMKNLRSRDKDKLNEDPDIDSVLSVKKQKGIKPYDRIIDPALHNMESIASSLYKIIKKKHSKKHSAKKLFECINCGYTCKYEYVIKKHIIIHTGQKPFACSNCFFRCAFKSALKRHILRFHSDKKRFECSECDFKSNRSAYFKVHLKSHSCRKLLLWCDKREVKCINKYNLLTDTVEKRFICDKCDFISDHKIILKQHLLTHMTDTVCVR